MATKPARKDDAATSSKALSKSAPQKELYPMVNWKYDLFLYSVGNIVDMFFREVVPRGAWRVPQSGPVLFVAAPHANQFVDALILQRTLRNEANRRVSLLIAQKSVHGFIGWGSRQVGAVPVGRAQDSAKPATGTIYLPDPINDPTLIRGIGTKFGEGEGEVQGMLFLPPGKKTTGANVDIAQIIGPEEIRVKRPFKGKLAMQQLTGRDDIDESGNFTNKDLKGPAPDYQGTKYKLAPHIDQTKVYEAVFSRLRNGGCVGIFPEGGSHDRTELLPLKAGVAIMALGTLAEDPDCGLKIVPVGMNYFHAHKFRSRAVVEFGAPFEIPRHLVELYRNNQRREAIGQVIDTVYQALSSVTVSAPNYDNLMMIQAARRLYNPTGKKLPLPVVVELNRRLSMGYERYKDDERITSLSESVKEYNSQLHYLNLKDHQVQYARMSIVKVIFYSIYRSVKLLFLFICTVPGLLLFSPVFVATKVISRQKAKTALAGSTVKIRGRDVMATWKILVAIGVAPMLYHFYSILLVIKVWHDRLWGYVPEWVPLWTMYFAIWPVMVGITFAALRFGEVGMDIFKSLRPLVLCLQPSSSYNIQTLRVKRAELSAQVTELINTLGPEMFPDFDKARLVPDILKMETGGSQPTSPQARRRRDSDQSSTGFEPETPPALSRRSTTQSSRALPRNDSFSNIGSVGIFSTRPPSRARSRSRSSSSGGGFGSGGFPLSGFTTLDSAGGFDEASRKIREAMKTRRRKTQGQEQEEEDSEEDEYNEARKKDRAQSQSDTTSSISHYQSKKALHPHPPKPSSAMPPPPPPSSNTTAHRNPPRMPVKQKMAFAIKSLVSSVLGGGRGPQPPAVSELFTKTDPAVDGDDCLHDCDSCSVKYPRGFKIDTDDVMYGQIKAWSTHLLVGTGKADWVRDVADEKGSVMEAVEKASSPTNGNLKLSASNIPTPHDTHDYSEPTTALLLPAFTLIHNVHPLNAPQLVSDVISHAPTSTSPMTPFSLPASLPSPSPGKVPDLTTTDCPHRVVILMCSQRTRDVRCGQSAPLLRKELERQLRPLGLYRDLHDERPGGVGIYFISHVGGHKYSANVMVYRRPNAFGLDDEGTEAKEDAKETTNGDTNETNGIDGTNTTNGTNGANGTNGTENNTNGTNGAAQCIWLARVMPEDCENLVKYTVLRGKVVKPESQLRGGFDRGRGVMSW
ncbi:Sucrase/ferredoxin-like-domain-containing protein [Dactylonectria macrodidyma]|uniref:Sucrase/ferredoxin-like-domain-containing protein n=1 Tax=Dactylonectria macrodidyma TaxID=307937 RepID=A0A9P9FU06_9HYPO|nr:Sucrase/ferredoxin-like-domain-containing protein [Dactylonectria macrodidyma]